MLQLTPRRLRLILGVSIALNLFLAAFVGGQRWRARGLEMLALQPGPGLMEQGAPDPEGTLAHLVRALPPADAAILRASVRARMFELLDARRGFVEAAAAAREEVARDPVNPAALQAAIAEARRQRLRFGPLLEAVLLEAVPRMSPEGRRVLAQFRAIPRR
ncbi:periplasmic heavy metal sensor [Roseomonas eburnea]|uniref:Periplasmic heavy metal sensor n=1 Tax=Neoroseomonas eburnea TaxID=1346889 RepID=A0A9X9XDC2_9PROT|nr:periplasmic heavy metal sensor [Neoroseomonas eburnea]MBR0681708.1 periplasmic heavy metal sensor [Neoroseomonas eburnea]